VVVVAVRLLREPLRLVRLLVLVALVPLIRIQALP